MNYQYLKTIEESLSDIYKFSYLLIYKNNILVAATMIFVDENFYLDTPLLGKIKTIFTNIRKIKKNFLRRKALFCGCPISEFNCINLDNSVVSFKSEIVQLIINELDKIAKEEKIKFICFKDLKCRYLNNFDKLNSNGYTRLFSLPGTEIVPLSAYIKFNNVFTHRLYSLLLKMFFRKYEMLSNHEKPLKLLKEIYPSYYN